MVTYTCPACGRLIAMSDINVQQGVALCRACGKMSRMADLADQPAVDLNAASATPPAGCSYGQQFGGGAIVRASLRSGRAAGGLLFFCLFWSGVVSIFVLFVFGALYTHFVGPLPSWFPVPDRSSLNAPAKPLGDTWFLCIFLIPFVAVGLGMFLLLVTRLLGRVKVTVSGTDSHVSIGVGPLNWTRRFDASKLKRVSTGQTSYTVQNSQLGLIRIEADRTVSFGAMLSADRRQWMLGVLQGLLVQKTMSPRFAPASSPLNRA